MSTRLIHGSQQEPGCWMAERLGVDNRCQHFVSSNAPKTYDHSGRHSGYLAVCGKVAIPAYDYYLAKLPVCPHCAHHHN